MADIKIWTMPKWENIATEVFSHSTPVFGTKVNFEQAFPTIADLRIEISESGMGDALGSNRVYTMDTRPGEYSDWYNLLCYNGLCQLAPFYDIWSLMD
jgi:hypothetical protein